jgi:hypothetical protein
MIRIIRHMAKDAATWWEMAGCTHPYK